MGLKRYLLISAAVLALAGCGGRGDDNGSDGSSSIATSAEFLLFPNSHASLGASAYDVVITNNSGGPISYTLTVTQTNGARSTFTGSLAALGSTTETYTQTSAGGATITLNSAGANATIALRVSGTTTDIATATAVNPSISLSKYQVDQAAYAQAYYTVVDPSNQKTTLADWKTQNGFTSSCNPGTVGTVTQYELRFRDVLDLGYGRHMCARRDSATGEVAVWVENFQVTALPGQHYGPLNLEAVVNDDRRWHVGTNAIEYSETPSSGGVKFVKFYTFNPDGTRRTLVNLDGRGAKAMPNPCISCHGGTAWPLTANGLFPQIRTSPRADTLARMQPLNPDTLDFSTQAPWRRSDLEASLKGINQFVLCTYPLVGAAAGAEDACRSAATNNEWGGTAAEMIKSWYGGAGMPNATASDTYVPTAWTDAGSGVAGTQNLYQTVIAPYCRVCHLLRGNQNSPGANDIDFTTYAKFNGASGFTSRIKYHVFDQGNMPLAYLKYNQFWDSAAPDTLASFIPGATDGGGNALRPTRPVAITGPNRTIVTGVPHRLSAAESVNASSYRWTVTSANVANTTLTNPNSVNPTFTASVDDTYTLQLVVSNGSASSTPVTLTIATVASLTDGNGIVTVADPRNLRFSHIRSILQDNTTYFCASCHTNAAISGPPVYYNDYDRDGDTDVDADDTHQFYLDVRARVNLANVESSRLLQRPSGNHHPGGLLANFDTSIAPGTAGRGAYDIFLNWILNGAPE